MKRTTDVQPTNPNTSDNTHTLFFAGGCFWGLESYFKKLPGVLDTEVGYANGRTTDPSYEEVCNGSGHAEAVAVTYDRNTLSTQTLIEAFFFAIDPTSVNRQGNDIGIQYRSGIYYQEQADRDIAKQLIDELQLDYEQTIAIEIDKLSSFYPAEEYHQDYLDKNPGGYCHINPQRIAEFRTLKGLNTLTSQPLPEPDHNGSAIRNTLDALIQEHGYKKPPTENLRTSLSPEEFHVTQESGTESPFTNRYCNTLDRGIYVDIVSGEPLFASCDKFDAGCGWPSFSRPITEEVLTEHTDNRLFTTRTEVRSRIGNSHLGHVFDDGPQELGGLRYCINSAALKFIPYADLEKEGYGYVKFLFDTTSQ